MSKVIFSGVQPSGNLHIGNYIGALSQWKKVQDNADCFFCIVDYHAITVPQDPKVLREKILEVAALYIASGIDPKKSHIFVQSENPDHANLAWILNCITSTGELFRMTQFKDKWEKQYKKSVGKSEGEKLSSFEEARSIFAGPMGLFDYPVLMAADILLYQTDEVPVGDDQKQHIELTRDLAEKFNKTFGEVFKIPNPVIQKDTARIMSLQDPRSKMSKSDQDSWGTINLLDDEDSIRNKIMRAVTDSGTKVRMDMGFDDKSGVLTLLSIYGAFKGYGLQQAWKENTEKSYAELKQDLFEIVWDDLIKIQQRYNEIRRDEEGLRKILDEGRDYSISKSSETLKKVKELVGLGRV